MKNMSFVSLFNILVSNLDGGEKEATEDDIRRMFGWYLKKYTTFGLVEEKKTIGLSIA